MSDGYRVHPEAVTQDDNWMAGWEPVVLGRQEPGRAALELQMYSGFARHSRYSKCTP